MAGRIEDVPKRRRAGGHAARAGSSRETGPRQPYIQRRLGTFNILGEEGLCVIESNADRILHSTGMDFLGDPEILRLFADTGCDVQDSRVRFEPGFCRTLIRASAPAQFAQHARNPANTIRIGGDASVLCPSWGPPFVHDLDRGRRYATYDDFTDLVKL
ncbi:MAG: trimethylamine methyltransferase family protein, partial [Rhodobacter sp.]|nr:trimethylamine methyltransferase family protein [Rhodobacter sp.]